jgi:hypothetical protein
MGDEMAAPAMSDPCDVYHALALGRLRRGVHYAVDEEPEVGADGFEDGPPDFGECTPDHRATDCPLCAAAAQGVVPEDAVEAYHITSEDWSGGCILPDLRSALNVMGQEMDGREESVSFTISRWWMRRADMDRLPEFEG